MVVCGKAVGRMRRFSAAFAGPLTSLQLALLAAGLSSYCLESIAPGLF
jgi:hypothetical protein